MRPSSSDDEEANDLPVSLRTAMQSLRTRPVPRDALARSLTRAMALDARGDYEPSAIGRVRRSVRPWRGRSLRGALVVAVVLFVAALVPTAWRVSEPTTSWAQVVAAVHARPWIRYFEDVDDPRRLDMWCDQARQRFCYRREKWLHFANLRTRLYEIYDAEQNILTRAPLDSEGLLQVEVGEMQMLFQLTDAIPQKGDFMDPYGPVTARQEKKVLVDGREWIDFTFNSARGSVMVRVDPATNLPASLSMGQSADRWLFEYPADGPKNIYDLGAPATATVVDCRPPVEVAKIRKELRTAVNRLGDYVGHIVDLSAGRPLEVTRVWRAGRRFRCEQARPVEPEKSFADMELPTAAADESAWLAALDRRLAFVPTELFDGETFWQRPDARTDAQAEWEVARHTGPDRDGDCERFRPFIWQLPHNFLFPEIAYFCEFERAELTAQPDDGPPGSLRINSFLTDGFQGDGSFVTCYSKMWFDPARANACVKYFRTENDRRLPDREKEICCEMDGFRQHRSGVWYPTIVRKCDAEGNVLAGEQAKELRIFWDFDRPVPADAFTKSIEPVRDR